MRARGPKPTVKQTAFTVGNLSINTITMILVNFTLAKICCCFKVNIFHTRIITVVFLTHSNFVPSTSLTWWQSLSHLRRSLDTRLSRGRARTSIRTPARTALRLRTQDTLQYRQPHAYSHGWSKTRYCIPHRRFCLENSTKRNKEKLPHLVNCLGAHPPFSRPSCEIVPQILVNTMSNKKQG